MVDSTIEYTEFITIVDRMLTIFGSTDIYEAEKEYQASIDAVVR